MNARTCILPTLCLAGAALLLAPTRSSQAWTPLGGNLKPAERDVRVFDNFSDVASNNNTTPSPQFPGQTGAELAIWKGIVEWGSWPHGDGTGDSTQPVLGNGGANFDAFWDGKATTPGNVDTNIVSKINTCSSGVLAYCEAPLANGWRIRFCDAAWTWSDGPDAISGGEFDIQGIMVHEYGHALGLGHSNVGGATMWPSVGSGDVNFRSIEADDIAGVKGVYGVKKAIKPKITATVASAGTLTIHGTGFGATGNQVWFRPAAATPSGQNEPKVVVGNLTSNGLVITVTIPATAGPGDVIVRNTLIAGHASVSNAFPTDLVGTFGTPPGPLMARPYLDTVTPGAIEVLLPGTARTVTLTGSLLDRVTDVRLDGQPIERARWALVDAQTIALDMPQLPLGQHELAVDDGDAVAFQVVAAAGPRLELSTGDAFAPVDHDLGLDLRIAGRPGKGQLLLFSLASSPSSNRYVSLDLGAGFTSLVSAGTHVVPAEGWTQLRFATLPDPGAVGVAWYAQTVELGGSLPLAASNLQSIRLLP